MAFTQHVGIQYLRDTRNVTINAASQVLEAEAMDSDWAEDCYAAEMPLAESWEKGGGLPG